MTDHPTALTTASVGGRQSTMLLPPSKEKVNNEREKIDVTGVNLIAFDHDEETQEFFCAPVLA